MGATTNVNILNAMHNISLRLRTGGRSPSRAASHKVRAREGAGAMVLHQEVLPAFVRLQ